MKLKQLLLGITVVACGLIGAITVPVRDVAAADDPSMITCPAGSKYGSAKTYAECNIRHDGDDAATAVSNRINTGINVVLGMVGVVAVVMIIVGGIQYVSSAGDAAKATKARNTIIFSIAGLVIALLAFAIVNFVLSNVFK